MLPTDMSAANAPRAFSPATPHERVSTPNSPLSQGGDQASPESSQNVSLSAEHHQYMNARGQGMAHSIRSLQIHTAEQVGGKEEIPLHNDVHGMDKVFDHDRSLADAWPVLTYSPKFRQQYPKLVAYDGRNIFVESPDEKVRPFPTDKGKFITIHGGRADNFPEMIGQTFLKHCPCILDAHKAAIHEVIAELKLDIATSAASYQVNKRPVRSLLSQHQVYPLPGGKWMIPQPELRDCMFACEEMLLAEGKTPEEMMAQMAHYESVGVRRNIDDLLDSLQERSGREALLHEVEKAPAPASLEFLRGEIDKHGPCIFMSCGHARILDAIEKTPEGYMLTIRDPFSGSFLKIKDHEEFWRSDRPVKEAPNQISETNGDTPRYWQAIFLPRI